MDTSETDALYERLLKENPGNLIYLAEMLELARKLEQERDEANYFLNELAEVDGQLKLRINELCEVLQKAEQERDEAQYKLENARQSLEVALEDLDEAKRERDEWAAMCGRYKQERDEAREQRGPGAAPHRKN
jgi:chromosome segregation ATPase